MPWICKRLTLAPKSFVTGGRATEGVREAVCCWKGSVQGAAGVHGTLPEGERGVDLLVHWYSLSMQRAYETQRFVKHACSAPASMALQHDHSPDPFSNIPPRTARTVQLHDVVFMLKVHGDQCLRCTASTVRHISARQSCCTAVRDAKKYGLLNCQVGESTAEYRCSQQSDMLDTVPWPAHCTTCHAVAHDATMSCLQVKWTDLSRVNSSLLLPLQCPGLATSRTALGRCTPATRAPSSRPRATAAAAAARGAPMLQGRGRRPAVKSAPASGE